MPSVSVCLATFNQPRALELALEGYARQTSSDFEIVVADDGSDADTRAVVDRFRGPLAIEHVRHEHTAFRKAKILNEAVRKSRGRTLIFSDGDCIPEARLVEIHGGAVRPLSFCVAGYVRVPADRTPAVEQVRSGEFERLREIDASKRKWLHFKNLWLRPSRPKAYGCHLSVDRDAFYAVNGFDEIFEGFGKEDSDLRNRLARSGARPISLWDRVVVFHLDPSIDPKRANETPRSKDESYYRRADVPIVCERGVRVR